jgi:hypothetical protein
MPCGFDLGAFVPRAASVCCRIRQSMPPTVDATSTPRWTTPRLHPEATEVWASACSAVCSQVSALLTHGPWTPHLTYCFGRHAARISTAGQVHNLHAAALP